MYKKILLTLMIVITSSCMYNITFAQVFNPNVCFINGQSLTDGQSITVYKQYQVPYGSSCNTIKETFTCNQGVLQGTQAANQAIDYPYSQCNVAAPMSCSLGSMYGQQTVIAHGGYATGYKDDILEPGNICNTTGTAGNSGLLRCENGSFVAASWRIVNVNDYQYPTCKTRDLQDCEFAGQIVKHGHSTTGFLTPFPAIGQQCAFEYRSCFDGHLNGSYQFTTCTETDAVCGDATSGDLAHPVAPSINLCSGGYILGSVGIASSGQWEWTCGGYGLSSVQCYGNVLATNTGRTACGSFPHYESYLTGLDNRLCTLGSSTGFVKTATGRNWSCIYQNTSAYGCSALNDIVPSGTISYNPNQPTESSVLATLSNLNLPGITIFNNNGGNTYTFTENGTFSFMLEADGKIGRVEANVDRISIRDSIFEQLLDDYEDNLCDQYNFFFQDLDSSIYKIDILTMKNLCIMQGYQFGARNVFLPEKPLTRREALVTLNKVAELLGDYNYIVEEPSNYSYRGVSESNSLFPFIKRGEDVQIMGFFKNIQNGNHVLIDWEKPITRKELKNMFNHVLFVHNLHEQLNRRLFNEISFSSAAEITRGEWAFILRRIIEGYEGIPIGSDYRLLSLLWQRIKNETLEDQMQMLIKVNKLLSKMPLTTLNSLGLTKWRLITDIQGVIGNTFPTRLEREDITIDMVREKLWYMKQPEYIIDLDFSDFLDEYIDDDYEDLYR